MNNYDKQIINKVDSYDYTEEVNRCVEQWKTKLKELGSNEIITLCNRINGNIMASNELEIVEKMAKQIIDYRIQEKAFVKLLNEGLIYPVSSCEGNCYISVQYIMPMHQYSGQIMFRRLIFDEFMIV